MLRMTKQADYGIVLMTHMATDPDRRYAAPELAEANHLPPPTVSKILKLLARDGLLESHRGVKGGYCLSRAPEDISVAQMITALDGPIALTECAADDLPGVCSQESFCRVKGHWQTINQTVRGALESVSLAQLAEPTNPPLIHLGGSETAAHP